MKDLLNKQRDNIEIEIEIEQSTVDNFLIFLTHHKIEVNTSSALKFMK